MNIFYLDEDPATAARFMVDKHIVKMPLESCQMLSTAHRLLDGRIEQRALPGSKRVKRFYLLQGEQVHEVAGKLVIANQVCYYPTHAHHPSTVWTMASRQNYEFHVELLLAMLAEYSARYGRVYKSAETVLPFLRSPPSNLPNGDRSPPTPAMPDHYKVPGDSVASYRNYYAGSKWRFAKWKHGQVPPWFLSRVREMWNRGDPIQRELDAIRVFDKKTAPAHPAVMDVIRNMRQSYVVPQVLEQAREQLSVQVTA